MSKYRRYIFVITVTIASLLPAANAVAGMNHSETLRLDR
jgi:hypothetical protein